MRFLIWPPGPGPGMFNQASSIRRTIFGSVFAATIHGIAVEGTILLGLDDHTEDHIRRLVDFSDGNPSGSAEFTI